MKIDIYIKFPCGYEYKVMGRFGLFSEFDWYENKMPICPLHGKKCSNKKETK